MLKSVTGFFIIFMIIVGMASSAFGEEILYARYPALSPNGNLIAFTYRGDIWTAPSAGGEAKRLTVHEAEETHPHFSPDGNMILFSSMRMGNADIFIIPVEGGAPKQLTYNSSRDIGSGWFPGGDSVLFTSNREGWRDVFKISIDGGAPIKLTGYPYEQEYNGRIISDGQYLIYNSGSGNSRWWRRDLKDSRNADIFIQDRSKTPFTSRRLTDYINHDVWPVYNPEAGEVYFVSCRGDWGQIWKIPFEGGAAVPITNFENDGVQWLNSNPAGNMLVFEQGMQIWILNPANNDLRRVSIEISTDDKENPIIMKSFNGKVEYYALSPDGKKIAAVIHGEIFVLPAEKPKIGKRITFTSARENFPVWSYDSKTIFYSSDRSGNYDIFRADILTGEETQLTDSPANEVKPIASPDSTYIAYYRGINQIIRYDLKSGKEEVWVEGNFFDLGVEPTIEYDISHDSRWLLFTMSGPTYETNIYAIDTEGEMQNLSRFAGWNYRPKFSQDGKQVYFTSYINGNFETYKIDLVAPPIEFSESAFDSLFLEDKDNNDKSDSAEKKIDPVMIDLERIESRRHKAFELAASSEYPVLSHDGETYYFIASVLGKPEIWSVNSENEGKLTQLTSSGKSKSQLHASSDSKLLYFLEDGLIKKYDTGEKKVTALTFAASMEIDIDANNRQKFNETWQMLNNYFYDTTFHGADWMAVRDKYEPALKHIRTEPELRNLIKEMMGELRASHLNIYSTAAGPGREIKTGRMGLEIDYAHLDSTGSFRIKRIVKDSPADLAGIISGQYIKSINGHTLTRGINPNQLLAGTEGRRLTINISDKPDGNDRRIDLKPVSNSRLVRLTYDDWVYEKRRMVDSLSDGRLAYMHIESMDRPSLRKFEQELVAIAENKEGLIIDVRNNFGGNIAVHLLGMLVKTPYILRNFRGYATTSENKMRSKAHEKPMALLINNYSASNSEIFAEGFRKLKLGKIIGEPTAGGVIGTASYYLIDGTRVRRPSWGAYTTEMEDTDIIPRQPDIKVENLPDDLINGRDPQLVRAVLELLGDLN